MAQTVDNTVVADFTFERATKNTVRFAEVITGDEQPAVGTLYIQKDYLTAAGVDVDAAEGKKVTATFTVA